jgi:putative transposase
LLSKIRGFFERSRGTYGSPRIQRALVSVGERVSRRRVERLMREAGRRARAAKLYRANPGLHGFFTSIPNRQLERLTTGPDQVWVGDVTYLKVAGAWRFLATVMDRYSRRVLGWTLGRHRDARLTLAALNRAVFNRRPRPGVIFHTDRGIEYAAYAFRGRLAALGFVQSMNRPGEIADNAHMESFFHSMKTDVVHEVIREEQLAQGGFLFLTKGGSRGPQGRPRRAGSQNTATAPHPERAAEIARTSATDDRRVYEPGGGAVCT